MTSVGARERKIKFDDHNVTIGKRTTPDSLDILVTVPCEDGALAFARFMIESPLRTVTPNGEFLYDLKITTEHKVRRTNPISIAANRKVTQDGLNWELPENAPEAMTSLLIHERKTSEFLMSRFRQGEIFVDVGANVGAYALRAALKGMKVVAFEPNPDNFLLLTRNAEANGLSPVLHRVALGAEEAAGRLMLSGAMSRLTPAEGADVLIRTLDSFALPGVDLMKIDVEGSELDVIRGSKETLRKYHPVLMIELHDWAGAEKEAALLHLLKKLGYQLEFIDRFPRGRHLSAIHGR